MKSWAWSLMLASFIGASAQLLIPEKMSQSFGKIIKLISGLIILIVLILPIVNILSNVEAHIDNLYIKFNRDNNIEAEEEKAKEMTEEWVLQYTVSSLKEGIYSNVANKFNRDDFSVEVITRQEDFQIIAEKVNIYYNSGQNFPAQEVKQFTENLLNIETETIERN